jgi:hypothetical protein
VKEDHVLVEEEAPEGPDAWNELAEIAVAKAAELIRKHRGDGYR